MTAKECSMFNILRAPPLVMLINPSETLDSANFESASCSYPADRMQ